MEEGFDGLAREFWEFWGRMMSLLKVWTVLIGERDVEG